MDEIPLPPEAAPFVRARHFKPRPEPQAYNGSTSPIDVARGTRGGDFLAAYIPISYTIEGVLPSGYVYGVTAKRGGGKTAFLIGATLAIIKGNPTILGTEVQQGRVAYVVKENPDDFRMKLAVNCYLHGVTHLDLNNGLLVLDGRTDAPESIVEKLKIDAEEYGPFQLVCYDTFQAGFSGVGGAEFNSNAEVLTFILRLRPIAEIAGKPSLLIAFHPTKNASEDDLVPYGGGSIINELDGNLSLWADGGQIKFHWNKVRGPEFEPQYFRIEKVSSPDIVDIKGRQILLPVMRPTTAQAADEKQQTDAVLNRALLEAMLTAPDAMQAEWAFAIRRSKSSLNDRLQKLKKLKLVEEGLGKWRVTPKGIKEAEYS